MSQYHVGATCDITFVAEADLSSYQYCIVQHGSAANGVTVATAATDLFAGVLQNAPESGEQATVRISGPTKLKVNGTSDIAAGAWITATTAGVGVVATSGSVVARALEAYTDSTTLPKEVFVNIFDI